MTSSPLPIPMASSAICRPAVAELTAMDSAPASNKPEKSCSNCLVLGPVVIQPERSECTTSAISSSPISGNANGRKWVISFRRTRLNSTHSFFFPQELHNGDQWKIQAFDKRHSRLRCYRDLSSETRFYSLLVSLLQ